MRRWWLIGRGAARWLWLMTCERLRWHARCEYLALLGDGHTLSCRAVRLPGSGRCDCKGAS